MTESNTEPKVERPEIKDLSDPGNKLDKYARQKFITRINDVMGVTCRDVKVKEDQPGHNKIMIEYTGWSPTLHKLDFAISKKFKGELKGEEYKAAILDIMSNVINSQEMRFQIAKSYGIFGPLSIDTKKLDNIETRHLGIDRGLVILSMQSEERSKQYEIKNLIIESLCDLHNETQEDQVDYLLNGEAYALINGLGHFIGTSVSYDINRNTGVQYDGVSMKIYGHTIPDIAASALIGKTFGKLMHINSHFDERIIKNISVNGKTIEVTLVPDVMPYAKVDEYKAKWKKEHGV